MRSILRRCLMLRMYVFCECDWWVIVINAVNAFDYVNVLGFVNASFSLRSQTLWACSAYESIVLWMRILIHKEQRFINDDILVFSEIINGNIYMSKYFTDTLKNWIVIDEPFLFILLHWFLQLFSHFELLRDVTKAKLLANTLNSDNFPSISFLLCALYVFTVSKSDTIEIVILDTNSSANATKHDAHVNPTHLRMYYEELERGAPHRQCKSVIPNAQNPKKNRRHQTRNV